jgi:GxxExxY protein
MNADKHRLNQITERIIGCAFAVSNSLGCGFLEKVYENALVHELRKNELKAEQQQPIQVHYDDVLVGDYVADVLVEGCVLVELKAMKALDDVHVAQCLNYLKATSLQICLLLNFGNPKLEVRRLVRDF